MEVSIGSIAVSIILVTVVTVAWNLLNWVWFKPKRLERLLRQQGFSGRPYRFYHGDMKETRAMAIQARSMPIDVSDNVGPRVAPIIYHTVKDYGKNSYVWMGPIPRVMITNPEHIKEIFMKIDDFHKPYIHPMAKILGCGVANHYGEKWAKHRKIINPAFHQEKLKLMVPVFHQCCNEMVDNWERSVSVEGSCELDVWPHLQNLTSEVISRTAFGSNYEEGKRIFLLLKELALYTLQAMQTVYVPGFRFLPTKMNRRMRKIDKEIKTSLKDIIDKRAKAMKAGEAPKADLLSILLESNMKLIEEHGNKKSFGLSTEDVVEECKLFYFAGQETTTVLLVWTLIFLCKYPEWQVRAREEVLQVFGNKKPDMDGLNHLKVATMILYEVLRLYPPLVALGRTPYHEDMKVGDFLIPTGVHIFLPTIIVHHDRELWGDDASEFKPERFAGGVAKATKNQVSFFPFGWGPRICIGQNFALAEAKMALALILQRFSFELSPSYVHAPRTVITLQPERGAQLIFHKL